MKRKGFHTLRRVAWGVGACSCVAGQAAAAESASWEYVIVATGEAGSLTPPMLSVAPNGALQVGFAKISRGIFDPSAPWPAVGVGGVYLQELGGKRRLLATEDDPTPAQAGNRLCFNIGCDAGAVRLSVDQGKVAFIASSSFQGQAAMSGIYLADGVVAPRRIVDTTMAMPGGGGLNFASFGSLGLSLNRGRVAFYGDSGRPDTPSVPPAWQGIFADFGAGLQAVATQGATMNFGWGAATSIYNFDGNLGLTTTVQGTDLLAFDTEMHIGNTNNVRAVLERDPAAAPAAWVNVADSALMFPFNGTSFFLGSLDATGKAAFLAQTSGNPSLPTGIYLGPAPLVPVATVNTPAGAGATLGGFNFDPAVDVSPRGVGQMPRDRWVAFSAQSSASVGPAVYLWHQDLTTGVAELSTVIDSAALAKLLAPVLGFAGDPTYVPGSPVPLVIAMQGESVRDGAVAFKIAMEVPFAYRDLIIVARKSQPTLLLKPDADTTVRADLSARRNDNYGMQDFIEVGSGRADGTQPQGAADRMRALLHFNLDALPALRLSNATLRGTVHSFDNGNSGSTYTLDLRNVQASWSGNGGEGNGYEGSRPTGATATLTDPDNAAGVAWAGAGANTDPAATNNTSQPGIDGFPQWTQTLSQATVHSGDRVEWDITTLATQWLARTTRNNGVALVDPNSDGQFRGVRLGSREGEVYRLPGWVEGPRLALKWSVGSLPGDLTGDGCVDRNDLSVLMAVVQGQAMAGPTLAAKLDLNSDSRVDISDARKLTTLFTLAGGAACPATAGATTTLTSTSAP